ncbi:two-component system chemotaxis sensor kinase CheA [Methanomicrobium sp. W14]|uniref:Hpt domain-containing protein n=1 Tax=Methanomicrobium sp. W14 TaxID=2817839 RepID=UPI001AEB140F|nr:Hpt domain-containing protein [Methanomicrobium sp. W14]MBP2132986.1 two-component system chemotaxis sensor kinase CheA [Methanomicrobium sp. W14]
MSDEDSYRKLFVAESTENHENIVNNILVLEEGSDDAAIDEIFRSAHTLKGMSASMGYMEMEHLCHKMEDIFQSIRSGEIEISPDLTDLLLACTDRIEEMIDDIEGGGDSSTIESGDLIAELKKYEDNIEAGNDSCSKIALSGEKNTSDVRKNSGEQSESPKNSEILTEPCDIQAPAIPHIQKYRIKVTVDKDCGMKDVRAMIVLQNLEDVGNIISSSPSAKELDDGIIDDSLEVIIESDSGEEALKSAASVTEISNVEIEPLDENIPSDSPVYTLNIKISPECNTKDIRAMIVLQNLEKVGTILSSSPTAEEIDAGNTGDSLEVTISSNNSKSDLVKASSGSEIKEVSIKPVSQKKEEKSAPENSSRPSENKKTPETFNDNGNDTNPQKDSNSPEKKEENKPEKNRHPDNNRKKEVKNIRVDIHRLDQMMNLVEDLVINGGRLKQIAKEHQIKEMDEALNMVSRSISDLQNLMMYIRMIPLNQIFNRFPRVVRDVAHHDGKEVEFIMRGGETELDRSVIDNLGDPLLHLIRNGVNHGIETPDERLAMGKNRKGTLNLSARREQGNVIIELSDDGAGIKREKVLKTAVKRGLISEDDAAIYPEEDIPGFLFQPGFSTAEVITDISGRGVGLDVVKSAIESLKGTIKVESEEGKGTTFRLTLPPTMAIIEVMMVRINDKRCAIPINAVVEVAKVDFSQVTRIGKSEAILLRDEVLQINRLDQMFGQVKETGIVVIVQYKGTKCCIPVDIVEGQQEVVVKPVSNIIGNCPGVGGVTIPGDGDVLPILDVNTMILN